MANSLYDKGREGFLDGSINWSTDTVKAVLVGAGYTPDVTADTHLADVPGGEIIATSGALSAKTETGGVAAADNTTFTAVSGADGHFVVVYQDTGDPTTARLIALIDTAVGLPVTPGGGNIVVSWDTGPNKIFRL